MTHVMPFPQVSRLPIKHPHERPVNTDRVTTNPLDRINVMARRLSEHDPAILEGIQTFLEKLLHAFNLDLPPLTPPAAPEVELPAESGSSRVVTLASGATLRLSVSMDVLRLIPADRSIVFGLIDLLEAYEETRLGEDSA